MQDQCIPQPTNQSTDAPLATRRQYLQIKARYPEYLLLFRLGSFYEAYDRDAEIAAEALTLAVLSRDVGRGVRVPMVGIPYADADRWIATLVNAGHKVAICESIDHEVKASRPTVQLDLFGGQP